jgi:serine/threonine protein kinase
MSSSTPAARISSRDVANFMNIQINRSIVLGRGTYGTVYAGIRPAYTGTRRQWSKLDVAVKECSKPDIPAAENQDTFTWEVEVISKLNHPACLPIVAWRFDPFILATPRMRTDLQTLLNDCGKGKRPGDFTPEARSIIILGVASGLAYIHKNELAHCDIKPGNIFLDDQLLPKIGDFGLAKSVNDHKKGRPLKGPPVYQAPEWREGKPELLKPLDVYAYGILVWELVTGLDAAKDPFWKDETHRLRPTFPGPGPQLPPPPQPLVDLIEQCLAQNPRDRPTFEQIVARPDALKFGGGDFAAFHAYAQMLEEPYPPTNFFPAIQRA